LAGDGLDAMAERSGHHDGTEWALGEVEGKGLAWLRGIDFGETVPRWRAFRRCADPDSRARSNSEVYDLFFVAPGPFVREYVDAFIDAALETLRNIKAKPQ
jgi:hypothetical protein